MKSITYISKVIARQSGATVPVDLSQIYCRARRFNSKNNISGVLSYRLGYYFQTIEGEDQAVNDLFSKVSKDKRHTEPTIIFDSRISERSFSRWPMKLLQSINHDKVFNRFIHSKKHLVSGLSTQQKFLLDKFFDFEMPKNLSANPYQQKTIKLEKWPNFISVKQTPPLIELCATIMKSPKPYELIVNSNTYGSQLEIDTLLDELTRQDILILNDSLSSTGENIESPSITKDPVSFYSRMKAFLGITR